MAFAGREFSENCNDEHSHCIPIRQGVRSGAGSVRSQVEDGQTLVIGISLGGIRS